MENVHDSLASRPVIQLHAKARTKHQTTERGPSRSADFVSRTRRGDSAHRFLNRGIGVIVRIEEVMAGQVFTGRRTSLRAGSASQVFARSRTASEDKDAGHRPEGTASAGHAFKTGVGAKAPRRVRFPSASAWRERGETVESGRLGIALPDLSTVRPFRCQVRHGSLRPRDRVASRHAGRALPLPPRSGLGAGTARAYRTVGGCNPPPDRSAGSCSPTRRETRSDALRQSLSMPGQ
jgi:hypothetical protein